MALIWHAEYFELKVQWKSMRSKVSSNPFQSFFLLFPFFPKAGHRNQNSFSPRQIIKLEPLSANASHKTQKYYSDYPLSFCIKADQMRNSLVLPPYLRSITTEIQKNLNTQDLLGFFSSVYYLRSYPFIHSHFYITVHSSSNLSTKIVSLGSLGLHSKGTQLM